MKDCKPTQGNKLTLNASPVAMISTRVRVTVVHY